MKRYIALLALALGMSSCSQIIEIDYESIEDLYVVMAEVSEEKCGVTIVETSDMDKPIKSEPVSTATVSMSSSRGDNYLFEVDSEGKYSPTSAVEFVPGSDYTLSVEVGDKHFVSKAHLCEPASVVDVTFNCQAFSEDMNLVFCNFSLQGAEEGVNYFLYRFCYQGRDGVKWTLAKDNGDGKPVPLMTHLYSQTKEVEEGDEINIEVKTVDKGTYDYLNTLALSGSSATNPISNFQGGCLGYFTIYVVSTYTTHVEY